jgi:hypothetical protein
MARADGRAARTALSSLVMALSIALSPRPLAAQTPEACASASEDAQLVRLDGRLRAARDKLLVCAQATCPQVVRRDCQEWLGEVLAAMPTFEIVLPPPLDVATSLPQARVHVRVFVDGEALGEREWRGPFALDPGEHEVRVDAPDGVFTTRFLAAAGERGRRIEVTFQKPHAEVAPGGDAAAAGAPVARLAPAAPPDARTPARVPGAVWGFGAAAVVSLGGFAIFGMRASSAHAELERTCGGTASCARSDVARVEREAAVADAFLAGAVVSAAIAGVVFVVSRGRPTTKVHLAAAPAPGGGSLGLVGRF